MKKTLVNSQLCNFNTYQMYLRRMLLLAENVFKINNLPEEIDLSYFNSTLLRQGSIAFFKDEELGLLALPFTSTGKLDVYGRPLGIQVYARNGYTRWLEPSEYVIMYDNMGHFPIYLDLQQYSVRLANLTRVSDVNIAQQKTPRIWKAPHDKVKTIQDLVNNVDGDVETVLAFDDLETSDMECVLEPAPYVADKLRLEKTEIWNELLRYIGISNISIQKKERMIKDEVMQEMGGTIASRYTRLIPRQEAAKKIIAKHALWVTLISAISAIPTGWMMNPCFIIDIIQFQIHVFAVSQKLLYLYEDEEKLTEYSSDTATQLMILMTPIMIVKQQFTRMLKSATGVVTKQVIQRFTIKALTQFSILNIVRQVAKWFGIVLTKETLLEGIDVAIIIICAIISGLISLWLFKPMANNLMKYLKEETKNQGN